MEIVQVLLRLMFSSPLGNAVSELTKEHLSKLDGSDLRYLRSTYYKISKVLRDAEAKEELSRFERQYIEKLKDVLYDVDDLSEELLALNDHFHTNKTKVQAFFSYNLTFNMALELANVRKKLGEVARDGNQFRFSSADCRPIWRERFQSCSYVYERGVIGREDDVEAVVNLLLDSDTAEDVSFVSIVGMGGLGKTTLAQLVFNHARVQDEFDSRLWVCVSDVGQNRFDVKAILVKILESATGGAKFHDLNFEIVANLVREKLQGKKYLLILDDFWNENRSEFLKLRAFLMFGARGSRVVVTTRLKGAARIMGCNTYELNALSEDNSWRLFAAVAFSEEPEHCDPELVAIGKKIVQGYDSVPLAIKVAGSFLHGQATSKWLSFLDTRLANFQEDENAIISSLKLSYYNLAAPIKSCFCYCALFPKDFELRKEMLVSLWIAQGYIEPLYETQSIEDAAEEYFSILLQGSFFRDVKQNIYGEVVSCKMHNLMHDLARAVGGRKIRVENHLTGNLGDIVRHLFDASDVERGYNELSYTKSKIRTYLQDGLRCQFPMDGLVANWIRLRALGLHSSDMESLPDSIGKLLHLRYLDLSCNKLKMLPSSFTKLYNLQTLDLRYCWELKALPKDFSKLIKLRHLDISKCGLTYMPSGMNKLTCLRVLTGFVVAEGSTKKQRVGQLEDLRALTNLKGSINILIRQNANVSENNRGEGYLRSMIHLKEAHIHFLGGSSAVYERRAVIQKSLLLEKMQPHPNLRGFWLSGYQGEAIQKWGREDNWALCLPKLVKIKLSSCGRLQRLPMLSQLPHLKSLGLHNLTNLEYMENADTSSGSAAASLSGSMTAEPTFFPSLEYLDIFSLSKLKGWWRGVCNSKLLSFPSLSKLSILSCPELTSFPPCPSLETLRLGEFSESLVSLSGAREVLKSCPNLRSLKIENCPELMRLSGGLEHFTALESLSICKNPKLTFSDEGDDDHILWRSLCQSLSSLELDSLESMTNLPKGMQFLTTLQNLTIHACGNLKVLPEWISCLSTLRCIRIISCYDLNTLPEAMRMLTSLQRLEIRGNSIIHERCRNPDGMDWPKILHIPSVSIVDD